MSLLQRANAASDKHLGTLLKVKTRAGYSHTPASPDEAKKAARAATQLVEEALAAATPGP